jgi:hypothetical protein
MVNERVEHIMFGLGIVTEAKDSKIWVKFEEPIGIKLFQYPDAFDNYLKALNPEAADSILVILEELHRKQELIELELEKKEKEREAAQLEEKRAKLELAKKKPAAKSTKKKSQS